MANKSLMQWDPFRIMRRFDPWSDLREMQYDMDRLFNRLGLTGKDVETGFGTWMPAVESYVKGDDLIVKCELPGVTPNDVDVTLDEAAHQLIIKGERKTEKDTKEEDYIHREVS